MGILSTGRERRMIRFFTCCRNHKNFYHKSCRIGEQIGKGNSKKMMKKFQKTRENTKNLGDVWINLRKRKNRWKKNLC